MNWKLQPTLLYKWNAILKRWQGFIVAHLLYISSCDVRRSHSLVFTWQLHFIIENTPISFQCSQPHSHKTCAVWTVQESHSALHRYASTVCCWFSYVVLLSVTYREGEMSCVSSESFSSSHCSAPASFVLCATQMLHSPARYKSFFRAMKIWCMKLQKW